MRKPLILASNSLKNGRPDDFGSGGIAPRQDYVEIARLLGADVVGTGQGDIFWSHRFYRFEQSIRLNLKQAVWASRHLKQHDKVLSTSEKVAIPLAAAQNLTRQAIPHVVIAHRLSSSFKRALFNVWPLHQSFSSVICVCRAQAEYAVRELGIAESRVTFIYDKVDRRFFQPAVDDSKPYILAVGQEQRDYQTLFKAVAGTGIKLVVVASSPWSNRRLRIRQKLVEDATILSRVSYQRLKELYAAARLVVVPLFAVSYAAGVNGLLEAMAMAKPVIVSRTVGIEDYISHNETGVFIPPQDNRTLRHEILRLWESPREQKRLGANARQAVDDGMNLDVYAQKVAEIVQGADVV